MSIYCSNFLTNFKKKYNNLFSKTANTSFFRKIICILLLLLFTASIIPIIITMFFSFPVLDDYTFGLDAHLSVINGYSFWSGVIKSCSDFYNNWQGFFHSNFVASSQPFVIDESLYFISNLSFFIIFISSLFYFSKVILKDILNADIIDYLIITIPIIEIIIQFLPSAAEGIYWMDGSINILIVGELLFLLSFILKFNICIKKTSKAVYAILSFFLTISLSGDSLLTYATFLLLSAFFTIYFLKRQNKTWIFLVSLIVVYTIGIGISLLAPGNKVRMDSDFGSSRLSLISSIFYAIFYSMVNAGIYGTLCFIAVLIFITPVFWAISQKSKFTFKKPFLIFIFSYAVYSARMSVQLYAGGYLGSPRQMNQYYIGFVICFSVSWLYFIGWLSKRQALIRIKINKKQIIVLYMIVMLFFVSGKLGYGKKKLTSISTGISLVNGQTQQYKNEMSQRISILKNDKIKKAELIELSVYPIFFPPEPLSKDYNYWVNRAVAKYYQKECVILKTLQ